MELGVVHWCDIYNNLKEEQEFKYLGSSASPRGKMEVDWRHMLSEEARLTGTPDYL